MYILLFYPCMIRRSGPSGQTSTECARFGYIAGTKCMCVHVHVSLCHCVCACVWYVYVWLCSCECAILWFFGQCCTLKRLLASFPIIFLRVQLSDMQVAIGELEVERDFYFGKLRDIEVLCQENEAVPEVQVILEVMYATAVSWTVHACVEGSRTFAVVCACAADGKVMCSFSLHMEALQSCKKAESSSISIELSKALYASFHVSVHATTSAVWDFR